MMTDDQKREFQSIVEFETLKGRRRNLLALLLAGISLGAWISFLVVLLSLEAYAGEVDTTKAVIHHTASGDVSAATIDQWHKERGWDGIGYHKVIRRDGTVEEGRSLARKGAHAKNGRAHPRNHFVGIVLTGRETFTPKQIQSLKQLLQDLGVTHIENHHEECPGIGIDLVGIAAELGIDYEGTPTEMAGAK